MTVRGARPEDRQKVPPFMGDSRAFPVDASAPETMKDLPDKRAGT